MRRLSSAVSRTMAHLRSGLLDDVLKRLSRARIVALPEPEQRLLSELRVGITLRDVEQLVDRGGLVALRVHEDQLLPHLAVGNRAVEVRQIGDRRVGLPGPEEGLLPDILRLGGVAGYAEQPARVLLAAGLGDREQDLVLELGLLETAVQRPKERVVLLAAGLADPEDRFLAQVGRHVRPFRIGPDRLERAVAPML